MMEESLGLEWESFSASGPPGEEGGVSTIGGSFSACDGFCGVSASLTTIVGAEAEVALSASASSSVARFLAMLSWSPGGNGYANEPGNRLLQHKELIQKENLHWRK